VPAAGRRPIRVRLITSRHCYVSVVGNDFRPDPALSDARDGSTARLTIRIRDERQIVQTVTLRSAHHSKISGLGCGKR
jgi:hypothetical protein